jgi:hypothetical protein
MPISSQTAIPEYYRQHRASAADCYIGSDNLQTERGSLTTCLKAAAAAPANARLRLVVYEGMAQTAVDVPEALILPLANHAAEAD